MKSIVHLLKKTLKYTFLFIFALLILVNLYIVLSGRFYIYKGVANTYLKGQTGPGIYDLKVFPYKTIHKNGTSSLLVSKNYNKTKLSSKALKYLLQQKSVAFLVFKNDSLVAEHYFADHDQNKVSNSFSAAKTVVSLLIGIAIEEGKIKSLDEPIENYLPKFKNSGISIRHLLWMSSGSDWSESGTNPLSDNAESYFGEDLKGLINRQNIIEKPGKRFYYQSGNSQMLGFIIEKATGKSVAEYCEEKIWKYIGASNKAYWSLDKENGEEKAFCCLYASARDFGKIGLLIQHFGKYNGRQIIPEWYMREMLVLPNLSTEEGITNQRYGLHIWVYKAQKHQVNYCRGIKGQYIFTIPEENLTIVRLGHKRAKDFAKGKEISEIKGLSLHDQLKVGHPTDIEPYLHIGRALSK